MVVSFSLTKLLHAFYLFQCLSFSAGNVQATANVETEISQDNVGHKLLKGLGWKEGAGLGAGSGGIVEPVKARGAGGRRAELGTAAALENGGTSTSSTDAYRQQLSQSYHRR